MIFVFFFAKWSCQFPSKGRFTSPPLESGQTCDCLQQRNDLEAMLCDFPGEVLKGQAAAVWLSWNTHSDSFSRDNSPRNPTAKVWEPQATGEVTCVWTMQQPTWGLSLSHPRPDTRNLKSYLSSWPIKSENIRTRLFYACHYFFFNVPLSNSNHSGFPSLEGWCGMM